MGTQRIIEFETTSDEGAAPDSKALASAFGVLAKEHPDGVRLAYRRMPDSRRFLALIELAEGAPIRCWTWRPRGSCPASSGSASTADTHAPEIVEQVGSFGFDL